MKKHVYEVERIGGKNIDWGTETSRLTSLARYFNFINERAFFPINACYRQETNSVTLCMEKRKSCWQLGLRMILYAFVLTNELSQAKLRIGMEKKGTIRSLDSISWNYVYIN